MKPIRRWLETLKTIEAIGISGVNAARDGVVAKAGVDALK